MQADTSPSLLRQLSRSVLWISAAMVLLTTLALGWFAQRNIGKESSLVPMVGGLLDLLTTAEHDSPQALVAAVKALTGKPETDKLRLQLVDAAGQTVFDSAVGQVEWASPALPQAETRWTADLRVRGQETPWQLTVLPNPRNEWEESKDNLLVALGAVLALTATLYAAIRWRLQLAFAPLNHITEHLRQLESSVQETSPLADLDTLELGRIARSINHLQAELIQQQTQRQGLMNRLQDLQESERRQIAHELHDEWGQHLTALQVDAATLLKLSQQDPRAESIAKSLLNNAQTLLRQLRNLLQQLRPAGLDGDEDQTRALAHSLTELVQQWQQRLDTQTTLTLQLDLPRHNMPSRISLATYRIVQESLTNAARHAKASHIAVDVRHEPARNCLQITVADDGDGADLTSDASMPKSLRERVHAQAGQLTRLRNQPKGWIVSATLPLPEPTVNGGGHVD